MTNNAFELPFFYVEWFWQPGATSVIFAYQCGTTSYLTLLQSLECLFYLWHVRARSRSFIKGEVFVDSDQSDALTSRSLEIEVRVRYFKLPDESGLDDFSGSFLHVVRLDFQPNRSGRSQKLALISYIPIEKRDKEVFSNANEVPFRVGFRDFATEDVAIKLTNAVSILPRN